MKMFLGMFCFELFEYFRQNSSILMKWELSAKGEKEDFLFACNEDEIEYDTFSHLLFEALYLIVGNRMLGDEKRRAWDTEFVPES